MDQRLLAVDLDHGVIGSGNLHLGLVGKVREPTRGLDGLEYSDFPKPTLAFRATDLAPYVKDPFNLLHRDDQPDVKLGNVGVLDLLLKFARSLAGGSDRPDKRQSDGAVILIRSS